MTGRVFSWAMRYPAGVGYNALKIALAVAAAVVSVIFLVLCIVARRKAKAVMGCPVRQLDALRWETYALRWGMFAVFPMLVATLLVYREPRRSVR